MAWASRRFHWSAAGALAEPMSGGYRIVSALFQGMAAHAPLSTLALWPLIPVELAPPILDERFEVYANPLPHVLILTAIVVGVATLSLGFALVVRIQEAYGTIEEDEIHARESD